MKHQCISCGKKYENNAPELLQGCKCGHRVFFYISSRAEKKLANINKLSQKMQELLEDEAKEIIDEKEVAELICVKVLGRGKYSIDLDEAFSNAPVVYKLDDGKFIIDVEEGMKQIEKSRNSKSNNKSE